MKRKLMLCAIGVGLLVATGAAGGIATGSRAAGSSGACQGPPPSPGDHCLPLPVQLILKTKSSASGCGRFVVMQLPLDKDAVQYDAEWTNYNPGATPWSFTATGGTNGSGSGPYGEEVWSTTAITPQNTGVNLSESYKVPKGNGAWFVDAGGGPGPCSSETGSAYGWAWTAHPVVSGQVTVAGGSNAPIVDMPVRASCPGGSTTKTDSRGDYGFVLDPGSCTIAPQPKPGDVSTPAERDVDVADRDIKNVDFEVSLACHVSLRTVASAYVANGTYKGAEREEYNSTKCQPDTFVATVSGGKITIKWNAIWLCHTGTSSSSESGFPGIQGGPVTIGPNGQFTITVDTLMNGTDVMATITGVVTSSGVTIQDASGSASSQNSVGLRNCDGGVTNVKLT